VYHYFGIGHIDSFAATAACPVYPANGGGSMRRHPVVAVALWLTAYAIIFTASCALATAVAQAVLITLTDPRPKGRGKYYIYNLNPHNRMETHLRKPFTLNIEIHKPFKLDSQLLEIGDHSCNSWFPNLNYCS